MTPEAAGSRGEGTPRTLRAGIEYYLLVFAAGFLLGTLRRLLLTPALGATGAVLAELPVMLAFAWLVCRRLVARHQVPRAVPARLAMGGLALALLMAAEFLLGAALGRPPAAQVRDLVAAPGLLGLAGQIAFGLFPTLQGLRTPATGR